MSGWQRWAAMAAMAGLATGCAYVAYKYLIADDTEEESSAPSTSSSAQRPAVRVTPKRSSAASAGSSDASGASPDAPAAPAPTGLGKGGLPPPPKRTAAKKAAPGGGASGATPGTAESADLSLAEQSAAMDQPPAIGEQS